MPSNLYAPHIRTPKTTASIMRDVCIALCPALIGSVIFFGIRSLLLTLVSVLSCVIFEALWQKLHKLPVTVKDFSAVVTGMLIAFNVSSTTPYWVVIIASAFSIIIVKQFFGGIGSNVMNPALMGKLFMSTVYPTYTMNYVEPMQTDLVAGATMLSAMKSGREVSYTVMDAFLGKVPGALGETSALLILIGFAYLIYKKEVNWKVSLAFMGTVAVIVTLAGQNPLAHLCAGGLMLGGCFMLTDYNLTNRTGNILMGVCAGIIVAFIRVWGMFPEGVCYSILFVNCMSELIKGIKTKHIYGKD
ncbi:MAG: RnfABCDGE type electron transport complex subunit D [Erysipelotrichaceae bacterium]|nr:RnfABCDGE type electron transport complex subunit D [Erysipelotrichaceae bacterium]